jgi:hypothetical protein
MAGPNEVTEKSLPTNATVRLPNSGDVMADIKDLISTWDKPKPDLAVAMISVKNNEKASLAAQVTAGNIAHQMVTCGCAIHKAGILAELHHIATGASSLIVSDPKLLPEHSVPQGKRNESPARTDQLAQVKTSAKSIHEQLNQFASVRRSEKSAMSPSANSSYDAASSPAAPMLEAKQMSLQSMPAMRMKSYAAKDLAGATNGLTDDSLSQEPQSDAKAPVGGKAQGFLSLLPSLPNENGGIGPDGKPTPEPETYFLIAALVAMIGGAFVMRKRLRATS